MVIELVETYPKKPKRWQARIKITHIPAEIENQTLRDYVKERDVSIRKSFLTNPFLDDTVYGMELELKNDFSWTFFISEKTRGKALVKGYSYLRKLEMMYPGLSGKIEIVPIEGLKIKKDSELFELVASRRPIKFNIIEKIIHLFKKEKIGELTFYFFWQRDDSIRKGCHHFNGDFQAHFKLNIWMRIDPYPIPNSVQSLYHALLKGFQEYLTIDIFNYLKVKAEFERRDQQDWSRIISSNVMYNNSKNKSVTGEFYNLIRDNINFCFVYPAIVDFTFPANSPILAANILKSRNYQYKNVSISDKDSICIGNVISNGIVESNYDTIPINHFEGSTFIGGNMGTGKTRLLTQISREFHAKAPNVGILYLNVGKPNQEHLYQHDIIIKYGDPEFNVPYFVEGDDFNRSVGQTADYLTASLGLREPVPKLLKYVMEAFKKVNGEIPPSIRTLFRGLQKYYRENRYDSKYQQRIQTAINNRVIPLVSDDTFEKCMCRRIFGESILLIPQWFLDWRNGKKVILDISMCDDYVKLVLCSAIFQMIFALTHKVNGLTHLIVIDEAHVILGEPRELNTNSDIFIAKKKMGEIFDRLLGEFRSRGLSFIIADVNPSNLVRPVTELPSLKILFRMGEDSIRRFTKIFDDYKFLMLLEPRHALVLNGNNSERYAIKTITVKTDSILPLPDKNAVGCT